MLYKLKKYLESVQFTEKNLKEVLEFAEVKDSHIQSGAVQLIKNEENVVIRIEARIGTVVLGDYLFRKNNILETMNSADFEANFERVPNE